MGHLSRSCNGLVAFEGLIKKIYSRRDQSPGKERAMQIGLIILNIGRRKQGKPKKKRLG